MQPPSGLDITQDAASVVSSVATMTSTIQSAAVATVTALAASATSSPSDDDDSQGECRLLGPFALFIQVALGGLALLSLVYKRWKERPQRPLKIWFFDVSKQVNGSILVHIVNVGMSMLTSGRFSIKAESPAVRALMMVKRDGGDDVYVPNPCSFYLLNLAIDTTIGIPILLILLRLTTVLFSMTRYGQPPESIQSGHYGTPPKAWWWIKQSLIYFIGLLGMKICVLIIFVMIPGIAKVGDWALSWTEGNEKLQIAFSMMIFPLIMNAVQYYIIDSFIKEKETDHEAVPSQDPDSYDDEAALLHDDSDEDEEQTKTVTPGRDAPEDAFELEDEREHHPATGSSSNRRAPEGRISPELYPKE